MKVNRAVFSEAIAASYGWSNSGMLQAGPPIIPVAAPNMCLTSAAMIRSSFCFLMRALAATASELPLIEFKEG